MSIALVLGIELLAPEFGRAFQHEDLLGGMAGMPGTSSKPVNHACDDMSGMGEMSVMGESMMAMMNHMCVTPLRPRQPGYEEKVKAIVIANPKLEQPQYHFNNQENVKLAETRFDPTRPSSLLYRRTPTQRYKLEGVMFTDCVDAPEDELTSGFR